MWLDVLAYTGLRRSDAVKLGRQHVDGGWINIRTGKTGTVVEVPLHPALARTLEAGPCGDLTFITGVTGKPLSAIGFYLPSARLVARLGFLARRMACASGWLRE